MGDSQLSRNIFNQDSDALVIPRIRRRENRVDDFGDQSADLILEPRQPFPLTRETYVIVFAGITAILAILISKVSKIAGIIVVIVLALLYFSTENYRTKYSSTETIEDDKMMLRVLISRYGKYAFYLYRDPGMLKAFSKAALYINETVDPYVHESVISFGKMLYYVISLEKGYAGDTRELTHELDLLRREGFNALAQYEYSTDPSSVYADDKTMQNLIDELKQPVQNMMKHAQTLIKELELSRIARDGVNTRTNFMALGPWYSYKPADALENTGPYS